MVVLATAGSVACSLAYSSNLNDARAGQDSSSEAGTSPEDGGTQGDASVDADAGDAGSARGCGAYVPAPKYCRDFDDGAQIDADGWAIETAPAAGEHTVSIDTSTAYSSPGSLEANLIDPAPCSFSRLSRSFSGIGSERVEVRFMIRPTRPWGNSDGAFAFELDRVGAYCQGIYYLRPAAQLGQIQSVEVNMQSGTPLGNDVRPLNGTPPVDEWTEIGIVAVPVDGGGVSFTYSFTRENGNVERTTHVYGDCRLGGNLTLKLGFHCEDGAGEVRYDDLRVDWK